MLVRNEKITNAKLYQNYIGLELVYLKRTFASAVNNEFWKILIYKYGLFIFNV